MNKFEKACIKERIIRLVKLKSTGTPSQLAQKLEISERSVKRIIRELKEDGAVTRFDFNRISYTDSDN
jgi:DNA-binding Lrp family transcriptional regulator